MLRPRLPKLLSWFRHGIKNSISERFNSQIQTLSANARGLRNFQNDRPRILLFCGKLALRAPGL